MSNLSDCLTPTTQERLARVEADLRMGLPCGITSSDSYTVIAAVETISSARFEVLRAKFGEPLLVLTSKRIRALMTGSVSFSALDGPVAILPPDHAPLDWFVHMSDPQKGANDPFDNVLDGIRREHQIAITLIKAVQLLPAALVFSSKHKEANPSDLQITMLEADNVQNALSLSPALSPIAATAIPLLAHKNSKLHVFRDPSGTKEHYAVEIGNPARSEPILTRLHSACFTGDVLGSLKCDFGPQLRSALTQMGQEGAGLLLYLNQEGRGIGLANKVRAYNLQSRGFDTVEASHHLGYNDDERDFRIVVVMLRTLGFDAVRLLTNNPAKLEAFEKGGVTITEQLPLRVGRNLYNENYLAVKAAKSGHSL